MFVANNEDESIDPTIDHRVEILGEIYTKEQEKEYLDRWTYFEVPYYTEDSNSSTKRIMEELISNLPCISKFNSEIQSKEISPNIH
jgi:hypothetical protein